MFKAAVAALAIVTLFVAVRIIRPGTRIRVSADTVAAFNVPHRAILPLYNYATQHGVPFPELFALFNAAHDFFPEVHSIFNTDNLEVFVQNFNQTRRNYNARSLRPYVDMYTNLFAEIQAFPIGQGWYEYEPSIMFGNSWGVEHNFQGRAKHMGTAIIDRENIRGRVPIVSMTAGQVTDAAWCNQLGYFVGITTESGTYFLYAHLYNIAHGLVAGQHIAAGQHLGHMGNSGGGRNARSFPVHLHLAISPDVSFVGRRTQFWINPYPLLRFLEVEG